MPRPPRCPSSDAGAMEVSTGCHHTSNHSSTLGATSVAVPPSQAQKKQAKSSSSSNMKQRRNSASPRQNMHGQHMPAASRRPHMQNARQETSRRGQFGFAVNGFHPQWSASSNLLLASRARDLTAFPISIYSGPPGSLNEQVATATNDLISRIRHDEEEKKNARKRHLAEAAEAAAKVQRRREQASPKSEEFSADGSSSNTSTSSAASGQTRASFSSLYGDVFLKASSGQILVSPGGRILAWNDRFVHISELNADQIAESLTVFNLVKPEYIPRLFDLFALALRGGSPPPLVLQQSPLAPGNMLDPQYASSSRSRAGSDDTAYSREEAPSEEDQRSSNDESLAGGESKSTVVSSSEEEEEEKNEDEAEEGNEKEYLLASMTVPCAHFPSGHATFVMTITLMNDENPNKRCFHCVFEETKGTPKNNGDGSDSRGQDEIDSPSFGMIRRISYAQLTTLL